MNIIFKKVHLNIGSMMIVCIHKKYRQKQNHENLNYNNHKYIE